MTWAKILSPPPVPSLSVCHTDFKAVNFVFTHKIANYLNKKPKSIIFDEPLLGKIWENQFHSSWEVEIREACSDRFCDN